MRKLQILSIDHKSNSSKERQAFELTSDLSVALSSYIKYVLDVHGYVYLSTCNRIEIYYDAEEDLRELIIKKWKYLAQINNETMQKSITSYLGSKGCINHILQLCIGTKSAILGDDQILSQLKKAFELARTNGTMSTLLERAYQTVMRFHKQVCRDTEYRNITVSLAYHSLKSIYQHIPKNELLSKSVLIIGAGDMAAQVVKYLPKFRFGSVSITNRTKDKVQNLVKGKTIRFVNYDYMDANEYDIIISCIDQGYGLIRNISTLEFYIDLSLTSSQIENLTCPGILLEELQTYITAQSTARLSSLNEVSLIMRKHEQEYINWLDQWWSRRKSSCADVA
ncbi:MAG: glutamyl-tRNA reductase [Saprospiraceae bacterium]|jgi:glutamyl-tRNA reductase|tara:strand:- start:285 stop:1298 length:1014 start_codon:yes stop_codon:yes gene_type:complete